MKKRSKRTGIHCVCFGGEKIIFVPKDFIFFEEQLQLLMVRNAHCAAAVNICLTVLSPALRT